MSKRSISTILGLIFGVVTLLCLVGAVYSGATNGELIGISGISLEHWVGVASLAALSALALLKGDNAGPIVGATAVIFGVIALVIFSDFDQRIMPSYGASEIDPDVVKRASSAPFITLSSDAVYGPEKIDLNGKRYAFRRLNVESDMSLVVELKSDSRDSRLTVLERQEDRWSILESDDDGGGGLDSRIILSATEGQELLLFLDGRVNFGAPELSKLTGVDMILEVYENNPLARVEMTNVFELVRSATLADTRSYARRENMIADVENPAQSTFQLNIKNDIGESACLIIDVQTTGDTTATLSSANGIELSYNDDGVGLGSRILWPIFQTSGDTEEVYVLEIKPWNQTSDFDLLVEVAPLDVCRDFDEYRRPIGEEMADAVRNDRVLGLADGPTR